MLHALGNHPSRTRTVTRKGSYPDAISISVMLNYWEIITRPSRCNAIGTCEPFQLHAVQSFRASLQLQMLNGLVCAWQ